MWVENRNKGRMKKEGKEEKRLVWGLAACPSPPLVSHFALKPSPSPPVPVGFQKPPSGPKVGQQPRDQGTDRG